MTEPPRIVARGLEAHELGVVGSDDHVVVPSGALGDVESQHGGAARRRELVARLVVGRAGPAGWIWPSEWLSRSRTR